MHSLHTIRSLIDIKSIKPILTASHYGKNQSYFIDKPFLPIYSDGEIIRYDSEDVSYIRVGKDLYLPLNLIVISDVINKDIVNPTEPPTTIDPDIESDDLNYVPDCVDHAHESARSIYHDVWIKTSRYGVYDPYLYWYDNIENEPSELPTELPTSIYDKYDTIVKGNILVVTEEGLVPLLTSINSKLMDIHYLNGNAVNYKITDLYIKWLGFDNLLNHDIVDDGVVSKFIENDSLKIIYGNEPIASQKDANDIIKHDDIAIEITNPHLNKYLDDIHSYWRKPEEFYHKKVTLAEGLINDDITQLHKILSDINSELDQNPLIELPNDELQRQVVDYGDIADYISLQSLVDVNAKEYPLTEGSRTKVIAHNSEVHYSPIESLGIPLQSDPYLYWNIAKNYSINRIIHEHDILEISILCKLSDEPNSPILWNGLEVISDRSVDKIDPILYYRYFKSNFHKLNWNNDAIRMDGYHITKGNLAEYSFSTLVEVTNSLVKLDKYFLMDISKDSINVFPINNSINEYYIKSCKLINIK